MDQSHPPATILTIDDERVIRDSFRCHLEDLDFQVVEAANGRHGLEVFREEGPDLVLVDLRMPEMSGLDFLKQVKQESPDTPIIVISGTGMIRDVVDALRLGAWDYLTKPVEDLSVLTHAVEQALDRARLKQENLAYQKHLENEVARRTGELETALKSARESRNQLDAILKSVSDGLFVTDMDRHIIAFNRAAQHLLQVDFNQVFGRPISQVLTDSILLESIDQALAHRQSIPRDWILERPEWPSPHTLQVTSFLALAEDGNPIGVISLLRDVTRERESDRMKNEFISTAAHELNTPLTSILGYSELLLRQEEMGEIDPDQQREFLEYIFQKTEHLSQLVDELLDLSRIQNGQNIRLHPEPGDIQELLQKVVTHYRGVSVSHTLELETAAPPRKLAFDQGKLHQVLDNILNNAIKYSPAGGTIKIQGALIDNNYQIHITDQGIGMSTTEMERMFDNFFRADVSNTAVGGLGLGMAIVKTIVEAHKGRVWVESALGLGTTVFLSFPLSGS